MNCAEAEVYVSALCDGQQIPDDARAHVLACETCHRTLRVYAEMGAELRLASLAETAPLPPLRLPHSRKRPFWTKQVPMPRLAIAGLAVCAVVLPLAVSIVGAQSKPLWFQFGYTIGVPGEPIRYFVAKEGFDETISNIHMAPAGPVSAALRIKIERIASDEVVFRARAVPAPVEAPGAATRRIGSLGPLRMDGVPALRYRPGEDLMIPIEGGGVVYLRGQVRDDQPRIAFGSPLIPEPDRLSLRSPALFAAEKLLVQMAGVSATARSPDEGVYLYIPDEGHFTFALAPFPGAVQARAEWGSIDFEFEGRSYRVLAAAPVTGGDQPRALWVRRDETGLRRCSAACLGAGPVPR